MNKRNFFAVFHLSFALLAIFFSTSGNASENIFLKPGNSHPFSFVQNINTVFISNPEIADYKIIDDKNIVVYAKKNGSTDLIVYNNDSKPITKIRIEVDALIDDLTSRVAKEYPGSNVIIKRFLSDDKVAYILSGTATDEETRDGVYQLVGSLVGENAAEIKLKLEGDGVKRENLAFMRSKVYDNVINHIELPSANQVNVKLTVVEVSKQFTDNLGIDWSSLTLDSIITGGTSVNNPGVFNLLGFKGGFDAANISTVINAINNDSIAKVLAQPNLTVLSGETANFLVGGEIPIIIQDKDSTSVEYKEYGIKLNVAAKVDSRKKIKLFIDNELSSIAGSYGSNIYQIPTLHTRRSNSTIELADGDSFAIGGLLSEEDRETLSKIPFIGDVPILGALARHATTERKKTELVVFATVNLVKPSSSKSNTPVALPKYRKKSVENIFFNVGDSNLRENHLHNDASNFLDKGGFAK